MNFLRASGTRPNAFLLILFSLFRWPWIRISCRVASATDMVPRISPWPVDGRRRPPGYNPFPAQPIFRSADWMLNRAIETHSS